MGLILDIIRQAQKDVVLAHRAVTAAENELDECPKWNVLQWVRLMLKVAKAKELLNEARRDEANLWR